MNSIKRIVSTPSQMGLSEMTAFFYFLIYYLLSMASMASITALLKPLRSNVATPTIVVPAGEHTASFIAPG